jgi:hypothetical protein
MKKLILILLLIVNVTLSAQLSLWSDFEDGTLQEWTNTDTSETLLTVENEADFWYLHKECDGSNSAVGEMAIINTSDEWVGNHWYEPSTGETALAAVHDIRMRNTNNYDIHLRTGITGSNGFQVVTTTPLIVPALSDWTTYELPPYGVYWLGMTNLTVLNDTSGMTALEIYANVIEMFEDVIEYRVIHNTDIMHNGEVVSGFLEIDEMVSYWLLSTDDREKRSFALAPNPTNNIFSITSEGPEILAIVIYSPSGKKALQPEVSASQRIDVSHLSSGIYFVHIESEQGKEIHKLIKE